MVAVSSVSGADISVMSGGGGSVLAQLMTHSLLMKVLQCYERKVR